mgnify:FL=1
MKQSVRWAMSSRIYDRAFRLEDPEYFSIGFAWADMIAREEPKEHVLRTPRLRLLKRECSEPHRREERKPNQYMALARVLDVSPGTATKLFKKAMDKLRMRSNRPGFLLAPWDPWPRDFPEWYRFDDEE